jgi:hypothetical protein
LFSAARAPAIVKELGKKENLWKEEETQNETRSSTQLDKIVLVDYVLVKSCTDFTVDVFWR